MSTKLSTLLNRMDRVQTIQSIDNVYKVQDLDEAIRIVRRGIKFPWALQNKNLKIFSGIELYYPESDFERLAFLDDNGRVKLGKPHFQYTSIQQFSEDPNNRNLIGDIWENGERKLGVKYKDAGLNQILIDECSDVSKYTPSGDFTSVELETVQTAIGSNSIKAVCVEATDIATMTINNTDIIDTEYKKKYFFAYIYLASVPTSIDLKILNDPLNHLSKNVIVQFDGSIFKANDWNIVAFDLNNCVVEGATNGEFNSVEITLNGVESGNYFFGETYLKEWKELDYNYYSKNLVKASDGTYKEQFLNETDNSFDLLDELIGEDLFSDVIRYEAICMAINEKENQTIFAQYNTKREEAWASLFETYPDLAPQITTDYYNFVE